MPEEQKQEVPLTSEEFGVSIDPATWTDPKQTFPGTIEVSTYRWASDDYRKATEFRPAITDPVPQWDVRVRRLDAKLVLPDGQQADAIRYGGIDLKKWSNADEALVKISSRFAKEWFIVNQWKSVFGKIEPPDLLVGRKAMFDFFPSKGFGGPIPARNVLVPVTVLPPEYEYTGDVRLIVVRERAEAGAEAAGTPEGQAAEAPGGAASLVLDDEEAKNRLVNEFLPGQNRNRLADIIQVLPPELRGQRILGELATGALIDELVAAGRIQVAPDGTITPKA